MATLQVSVSKEYQFPVITNPIVTNTTSSSILPVDGLTFTEVNMNDNGSPFNHLNLIPGLPITDQQVTDFLTPPSLGGLSGSCVSSLYDTVLNGKYILVSIPSSSYDTLIDGKSFKLEIPLDPTYSGVTSGLSATTIYTSFISNNEYNTLSPGPCGERLIDSNYYEKDNRVSSLNPYGDLLTLGFSDDIQRPNGDTGKTWSTGYELTPTFTKGKLPANFITTSNVNVDTTVGVLVNEAGLFFITHPEIVNAFNWSVATGGTGNTFMTFSTTDANLEIKSVSKTFTQNFSLLLSPETTSQLTTDNITYTTNCGSLYISEICLFDDTNRPLGVATLSQPLKVDPTSPLYLNFSTTL